MTIATVCAALKTICNGVTGVTSDGVSLVVKSYDPPPASMDSVKLPASYVFTGAAEFDTQSYGPEEVAITREYEVHCAVLAENAATPELREKHCRPLLEALRTKLLQYPNLGSVATVQMMTPLSDSGVIALPEYGGLYVGFIVTINTLEIVARTYASGE